MLENELDLLENGLKVKKEFYSDDFSPMAQLVSENMLDIVKQQIQFIEDALTLLK